MINPPGIDRMQVDPAVSSLVNVAVWAQSQAMPGAAQPTPRQVQLVDEPVNGHDIYVKGDGAILMTPQAHMELANAIHVPNLQRYDQEGAIRSAQRVEELQQAATLAAAGGTHEPVPGSPTPSRTDALLREAAVEEFAQATRDDFMRAIGNPSSIQGIETHVGSTLRSKALIPLFQHIAKGLTNQGIGLDGNPPSSVTVNDVRAELVKAGPGARNRFAELALRAHGQGLSAKIDGLAPEARQSVLDRVAKSALDVIAAGQTPQPHLNAVRLPGGPTWGPRGQYPRELGAVRSQLSQRAVGRATRADGFGTAHRLLGRQAVVALHDRLVDVAQEQGLRPDDGPSPEREKKDFELDMAKKAFAETRGDVKREAHDWLKETRESHLVALGRKVGDAVGAAWTGTTTWLDRKAQELGQAVQNKAGTIADTHRAYRQPAPAEQMRRVDENVRGF